MIYVQSHTPDTHAHHPHTYQCRFTNTLPGTRTVTLDSAKKLMCPRYAGGLPSGQTVRVFKACITCKTQEMPEHPLDEEEEEEEEKEEEKKGIEMQAPQTRVGKVRHAIYIYIYL